jgi:hypothetical protein
VTSVLPTPVRPKDAIHSSATFYRAWRSNQGMRTTSSLLRFCALCVSLAGSALLAQTPAAPPYSGPVVLDWAPPALYQLQALAAVKSSFTLDRNLLAAAAVVLSDQEPEVRQAVNKLDGVSVHLLRFGPEGIPDPALVDAVRDSYHLRGWKHVVTATNSGGPVHNESTDVWVVLDGANVRGAVILAATPKSLTLVTITGNLNPVDLLHLRGHFGIPRFNGEGFNGGVK